MAIVKSVAPVLASALTTIFGFLALVFMRFGIGFDLGIVLAKGVFFSLLSSFLLLPALTTLTYKLIDKRHIARSSLRLKKPSRWIIKFGIPILIVAAIVGRAVVPCTTLKSSVIRSAHISGEVTSGTRLPVVRGAIWQQCPDGASCTARGLGARRTTCRCAY